MSWRLGESVLNTAHTIDAVKMKKNSRKGNKNGVGMLINIDRWKLIDHPTIVPISTPEKELATMSMNAS
jgi:hypothetical protein